LPESQEGEMNRQRRLDLKPQIDKDRGKNCSSGGDE